METALIILGFVVFCGAGIAWDYYKPTRFRTTYRSVTNRGTGSGGYSLDSDCGGDSGDGGGD